MENLSITYSTLDEASSYAPILAYWSYREWYAMRDINFDILLRSYISRTKIHNILPKTFIALDDTFPVGMASIKTNDLWSRNDLNPWLASIYVDPSYRNMGIAKHLIFQVVDYAKQISVDYIYLFLAQNEQDRLLKIYKNLGWEVYDEAVDNDGLPTIIVRLKI